MSDDQRPWQLQLVEHIREDGKRFDTIDTSLQEIKVTLAGHRAFFAAVVAICSTLAAAVGLALGVSEFIK